MQTRHGRVPDIFDGQLAYSDKQEEVPFKQWSETRRQLADPNLAPTDALAPRTTSASTYLRSYFVCVGVVHTYGKTKMEPLAPHHSHKWNEKGTWCRFCNGRVRAIAAFNKDSAYAHFWREACPGLRGDDLNVFIQAIRKADFAGRLGYPGGQSSSRSRQDRSRQDYSRQDCSWQGFRRQKDKADDSEEDSCDESEDESVPDALRDPALRRAYHATPARNNLLLGQKALIWRPDSSRDVRLWELQAVKAWDQTKAELAAGKPTREALCEKFGDDWSYLQSYTIDHDRVGPHEKYKSHVCCINSCDGQPHPCGWYCRFCQTRYSTKWTFHFSRFFEHISDYRCPVLPRADVVILVETIKEVDAHFFNPSGSPQSPSCRRETSSENVGESSGAAKSGTHSERQNEITATSSNVARPANRNPGCALEGSESDDSIPSLSVGRAASTQRDLSEDVEMSGSPADGKLSATTGKKRKREDSDQRGGSAQGPSGALSSGAGRTAVRKGSVASSTPSSNGTIRPALEGGAPANQPAAQVEYDPLASVQASLDKLNMSKDVVRAKCTDQEWIDNFDEVHRHDLDPYERIDLRMALKNLLKRR